MTNLSFSPAFLLFVLIAAVLTIGCLAYLFAGVFGRASNNRGRHDAINVEIARDELSQLKEAHRAGQFSEEDYKQARADLEARLAETLGDADSRDELGSDQRTDDGSLAQRGRWIAFPGAVLVVGATVWLYLHVGDPGTFNLPSAENRQAIGTDQDKLPSIEEMLPRLEAHLQANPDDTDGWKLLGTTYHRLRRFHDANTALSRALELSPGDVGLMLQLADSRVVLADGQFDGDTVALIDDALLQEPDNVQGNWLRGMASQQAGETNRALDYWRRILPLLNSDPQSQFQLQQMIAHAEQSGASTPNETSAVANSDATVQQGAAVDEGAGAVAGDVAGVEVQVALSENLQDQLAPTLPVFVYARAVDGPPAPLAVTRLRVSDLPATIVLDDTMAMIPAFKLSGFDTVTIGARVAVSGNPVAQPGDWFTEKSPLTLSDTRSVFIEISSAVGE